MSGIDPEAGLTMEARRELEGWGLEVVYRGQGGFEREGVGRVTQKGSRKEQCSLTGPPVSDPQIQRSGD